jgi:hypothetical protein
MKNLKKVQLGKDKFLITLFKNIQALVRNDWGFFFGIYLGWLLGWKRRMTVNHVIRTEWRFESSSSHK